MSQFESFRASELYCQKCQKSMAVRERLLLVLPDKEIYEYLCSGCGASLGQRDVIAPPAHFAALSRSATVKLPRQSLHQKLKR